MKNLKLHLAGNEKTKTNRSLPVCGKVSAAIEYDTLSLEDFKKSKVENRCVNCQYHLNNN